MQICTFVQTALIMEINVLITELDCNILILTLRRLDN
jgi:hypothetical protein